MFRQLNQNLFSTKSTVIKRHEIIDGYKKSIDNEKDKEKRDLLLKRINQELARNIFFDQDELKKTMQELIAYSIK
ncbi:MAG TPA: hypothetical protein EYG73_02505 [Arcobacter sp.]|nr:hypothetical protein [Arcobacter sp.]